MKTRKDAHDVATDHKDEPDAPGQPDDEQEDVPGAEDDPDAGTTYAHTHAPITTHIHTHTH